MCIYTSPDGVVLYIEDRGSSTSPSLLESNGTVWTYCVHDSIILARGMLREIGEKTICQHELLLL